LRSWAIFGDRLRQAIHRLKYKGDLALGDVLSRPMIDSLRQWKWQVDLVTPVPIGLARLAERGYNQAALLARPIAWGLGWPYHSDGLYRVRETRSQVGLSLDERQQNVKDAFRARSKYVAGKSVLVVDDVTTSGATLKACAAALLEAGADQVYGLTLARTAMEDPRDAHPA
jgi:ComF family protein